MSIGIIVDEGSLRISSRGSITGICFVSIDGHAFPGRSWDDFPIVILGWWSVQLRALVNGASEAELCFMDGPYRIGVKTIGNDLVGLELFHNDNLERAATEHLSELLGSLENAAGGLLRQCDANGWSTAAISGLRTGVSELQRLSRRE